MELIEITSQHRRDFNGVLKCQFCGHKEELKGGYDDANYHNNVIPTFLCPKCNKSTVTEGDEVCAWTPKYPEGYQI